PHRVLVGWATVALFVLMLFIEATRANAVATLWGVAGAGLLVSVVLAEHGEHIQRRVWVRDNAGLVKDFVAIAIDCVGEAGLVGAGLDADLSNRLLDRKSTRLNSSHGSISYAVFCLKKKTPQTL